MAKKIDGPGIAAVGVGVVFLYGGIKGYSPVKAFENILKGENPNAGQSALALTSTDSPSGGSTDTTVSASASETQWIYAFLAAIGAPNSAANVSSVTNWIQHEKPAGQWSQWNNPLNTTQSESGATSMNSVGVKSYPSLQVGLNATIATLNNGYYSDILSNLHAGIGLKSGASNGLSKWSGAGYTSA